VPVNAPGAGRVHTRDDTHPGRRSMRGQAVRRWMDRRGRVPGDPGLDSESALRAAYAARGAELYRFALRQLSDDGTAQEVVQEVFLRAWRRADSFDPAVASVRVWLFAIARNVVIDEARRAAVRPWGRTVADGRVTTARRSTGWTSRWWTPGSWRRP
jgi:hypothetical protein